MKGMRFPCDEPRPTIMHSGLGNDWLSQWRLEDDGAQMIQTKDDRKPLYSVPSVKAIARRKKTFKVVSTFSGCGGSCLGYEMAGGQVVWASEFDANARECHAANFKQCEMDSRDIRDVQANDVLEAIGMEQGQIDVFDGSPPCQTFSTAGKRDMTDQRSDLFLEYARLLGGLKPKVFVAENVFGLIKGKAIGYFKLILRELKSKGYQVACRVLDAQWLGVPQRRQRCIFIGVRNDLKLEPRFPAPLPYRYSVAEACPWLMERLGVTVKQTIGNTNFKPTFGSINEPHAPIMTGPNGSSGQIVCADQIQCQSGAFPKTYSPASVPAPVVVAGRTVEMKAAGRRRKFTIAEVKLICSYPDDFVLVGSYAKQWARLGNSVPPVMMYHIATSVRGILEDAA